MKDICLSECIIKEMKKSADYEEIFSIHIFKKGLSVIINKQCLKDLD